MKYIYLSAATIVLSLMASCSSNEKANEETAEPTKPLVKVETVYEEDVPQIANYTATVEAYKTNNITTSTTNRIKKILVDLPELHFFATLQVKKVGSTRNDNTVHIS